MTLSTTTSRPASGQVQSQRAANVWYVHPYAGGPGVGRFSRPYFMAKNWLEQGLRPTIFCPSFHHLLDVPRAVGTQEIEGVTYRFVKGRTYGSNGLSRLGNMADFTARMLANASAFAQEHGRPDAIIGSSPHPYIFLATHRLARKFGAVSIFEVRDLWPLSLVELAGVRPTHPLVRATAVLERHAYRKADHVVSLHPNTYDYMAERGIDRARWHYIPNGIDEDEVPVLVENDRGLTQIRAWRAAGKFVVLYAGALGLPNNVDTLVEAGALLRAQGHDHVRIAIVGRGELQDRLAEQVRAGNLGDVVGLFGQVPKPHALGLMSEVDAGYISLKPKPIFKYGISPNKLFDYMLAGLPIISAIESVYDPVTDAACGVVTRPNDSQAIADAILRLAATSREERAAMGERARTYVLAKHDYANLSVQYARLLRKA